MTTTLTSPSRRRRLASTVVLGLFLSLLFVVPASADDSPFRFEGDGYGHGVGLSQYGAQGRALDGQTGEQIVEAYYTGASVTTNPTSLPAWWTEDPMPLWVGLLEDESRLDFSADAGQLSLCQGVLDCPAESLGTPVPGESWSFRASGPNQCQFYKGETPQGDPGNCYARILLGGSTNTRVYFEDNDEVYVRGEIVIRPVPNPTGTGWTATFHVMAELAVEDYMLGVPEAVPSWQPAALEAQALASRTYAANKALAIGDASSFSQSVKRDCWCHVEDNTSDQVYVGWSQEVYSGWVSAVNATAGQYITHPDSATTEYGIILALYSSANGGASETNNAYWGSAQYPYLETIPDPWTNDASPHNPWSKTWGGNTVASAVGLDTVERVWVSEFNPSTSAKIVTFEGYDGGVYATTELSGTQTRSTFGLKSHFLDRVCRERGPYDDDGCSFFEHNIFNINAAGFVGTLPGNDYDPEAPMTRSSMAAFLADGLELPGTSTDYFPDDDSDPNEAKINALAEAGIVIGFEDGTYRPNNSVTRAEMAVYLTRALELTLPGSVPDPFPDVPGDSWFGPAVAEILDLGVTVGHQDGLYHPHEGTTREQMAGFLDRAFLGGF